MNILGFRGESATNYNLKDPQGYPGEFKFITRSQAYDNNEEETVKVATVTVGAGSGSQSVSIDGVTVTVEFDTDAATTAELLADEINLEPLIDNVVTTVSGAVITLTGTFLGNNFVLAVAGNLTKSETAATRSEDIRYGLIVVAGSNKNGFKLPDNDTERALGVLGTTAIRDSSDSNSENVFKVLRGDTGDVLEKGDAIAITETDFAPEDNIFYRIAGTGIVGSVSNTDGGSSNFVKLDRARAKSNDFDFLGHKCVRVQLD